MKKILLALLAAAALPGCTESAPEGTDTPEACATGFVTAFYNFDFKRSLALCTDSSDQWLRLFAANLSEDDVEDIRALTSVPAIDRCKVTRQTGDSATVVCELSHVFLLDTIGSRGHMADEATVTLHLVKSEGLWKVRMADLPRSGT